MDITYYLDNSNCQIKNNHLIFNLNENENENQYEIKDCDIKLNKSDYLEDSQTENIKITSCKNLVKINPWSINNNSCYDDLIEAVLQDGLVIQLIKNPSQYLQDIAIKQNPWSLQYIDNPSEQNLLDAVSQDGLILELIMKKFFPNTFSFDKIFMEAVKEDSNAIKYINNPSDELCEEAVSKCGSTIRFIKNKTDNIKKFAVEDDGLSLEYINYNDQTPELIKLAIEDNCYAINYANPELL